MKLIQIVTSPGHDYWVQKGELTLQHGTQCPTEVVCEAGRGIVGDRYYHGKPNRKGQVTFLAADVVEQVRDQFDLPDLHANLFRRNLIVADANLPSLLGQRFVLQGVEFEGSQECRPCDWMDRMIVPGVREFLSMQFRGGLRAKVLSSGTLRVNEM